MGMLTNYLQDISTRKTGRLLSNPHYTNVDIFFIIYKYLIENAFF